MLRHYFGLFNFCVVCATLLTAGSAPAQDYPGYHLARGIEFYLDDEPPPPHPPYYQQQQPYWEGNRGRHQRGRGGPAYGGVCVTSRGACPAGPLAPGSPCRCELPDFGSKRGVVQ